MLKNYKGGSRNVSISLNIARNTLVNQYDQNENIFSWNYMSWCDIEDVALRLPHFTILWIYVS